MQTHDEGNRTTLRDLAVAAIALVGPGQHHASAGARFDAAILDAGRACCGV
jgi:hypothetical protein